MKIFGIIYLIFHKDSGKVYVGQTTKTLRYRWRQHQRAASSGSGNNRIYRALRAHGVESFYAVVLHQAFSRKELDEMETGAILSFDSTNSERGYNIGIGGGVTQLFGEANPRFGAKLSSEHVAKIQSGRRLAGWGSIYRPASQETRNKLSTVLVGNKRAAGKPKSVEHRTKISEARKRYWESVRQEKI